MGAFGAKGIGDPTCNSIAPSIANAVADAEGVRSLGLPLTREEILKAFKGESGTTITK